MQTISSFKIRLAVEAINAGQIIAYPTEAVFGLGCDPLNEEAILNLLTLKKRPVEKGLILIASSLSQLEPYLQLNDEILSKVQSTWPGPVTWVIPAQSWVPNWLTGKHSSLAVRVSSHPLVQSLCTALDEPLVSTSANTSAKSPAIKSWQVCQNLEYTDLFILPGEVGSLSQVTPIYDALHAQQIR